MILSAIFLLVVLVGFFFFVREIFDVSDFFCPIIALSIVALSMFFFGLAGFLEFGALCVSVCGVAFFVAGVRKKTYRKCHQIKTTLLFQVGFVAVSACFIVQQCNAFLVHYDNYSHWALVVKYLLMFDAFPDASAQIIEFSNYPLGMSSLQYYFCKVASVFQGVDPSRFVDASQTAPLFTHQGTMLVAQNAVIFACMYSFFGIIKERKRFLVFAFLATGLAVLSYFNQTIRINNLLVDFVLPLLAGSAMTMIVVYKDDLKRMLLCIVPVLGLLVVVKSTGIVFALFALALLAYFFIRNAWYKSMRNVAFALGALALSFASIACWNVHVATVFAGVDSKFDMADLDASKTPDDIAHIVDLFFATLFDPSTRHFAGIVVLPVVAALVLLAIYFVRRWRWGAAARGDAANGGDVAETRCEAPRKKLVTLPVLVLGYLMVVAYLAGILAMYVYSMPLDEALVLAGFERYALSIVVLFVIMIALAATVDLERSFYYKLGDTYRENAFKSYQTKQNYLMATLGTLLVCGLMLLSEYNGLDWTNRAAADSLVVDIASVTSDRWELQDGASEEGRVLVYGSDTDGQMTSYYYHYVARYYLFNEKVDAICAFYEDNLINLLSQYDTLVIVESDADAQRLFRKYFGIDAEEKEYSIPDLMKKLKVQEQ